MQSLLLIQKERTVPTLSVHVTVSRLRKLLVGDHLVLEADEDFLHSGRRIPVLEQSEVISDLAVALVDRRNVDLRSKSDRWRRFGIAVTARDNQHVDSVVHVSVGRADDGTVPVGECLVVTYRRNRSVSH